MKLGHYRFLDLYQPPVIFDEVQYAPDLLFYIKEQIDTNRSQPGQFILTGSQNLQMMERVTESLAGRAALLRLLPLSQREIRGNAKLKLPWERKKNSHISKSQKPLELWNEFLRGNYPELVTNPNRDLYLWYGSYVQTYLERDVRTLRQVGDLTLFQNFLRALASRSAQLIQLTDLARDLGMAVNTIKAWISVLEATNQILVLRPYFANIGKRLVKTPKIYFTDVGTLCYLTGLRTPEHAAAGPMGGSIFETAVITEIYKTLLHRGDDPQLYFWRTSTGIEVDLLVEHNQRLVPIEIKLSTTLRPEMANGIKSLRNDLGERAAPGYVIHPGDTQLPLGENTFSLPYNNL
ncbi:DUF4143 domain-containing protein [bacterium]|nr:DUF4143 domain-containing protein [bacterium]